MRVARSAWFFGVVVTVAACIIDPAVYLPFLTPKRYALILASAGALVLWAVRTPLVSGGRLQIGAIEATLAASILWGVYTNPDGLQTQAGNWFWLAASAFLLTLVVRQLFNPPAREAETSGVPTRLFALADLMAALWIVGSLLAVHGLIEAFLAGGFWPADIIGKTAVASVAGRPNAFGACMAAGIIAALAWAAEARSRRARFLLVGAALLQLVAMVGNSSRGALLGLVTAGLFTLWLRTILGSARRRGAHALIAGLAALVAVAAAGVLLYRLNPTSSRGRIIAWEVSAAMLDNRLLTGVGAGRFSAEWGSYQSELWRHPEYAKFDRQAVGRLHPNSELFHRLSERGLEVVLYVMLWALALGFLVRALRRNERTSAMDWGLLALMVSIMMHSLVDGALRWEPTLVTASLAFGLIPAPVLQTVNLRRWPGRLLIIALAGGWAATAAIKIRREYPGYELWGRAERGAEPERLDVLVRAQRRLPSEPRLDRELGFALLQAGRPEEAASVLEAGLEAQDDPAARLALAEAQLGLGWLQLAEVNARLAEAGYPDRLGPRLLLARIHHLNGEEAQARVALASTIRRDTYFRTAAVDSLVAEATRLWLSWYDDEPPR